MSTLRSVGPVMPHSASTHLSTLSIGCGWSWPQKGAFQVNHTQCRHNEGKTRPYSQIPLGSFWKPWKCSFAGGQGRLILTPRLFILGQLAAAAGAFVRRQQGGACVLPRRSGPSVTCVRCTPSASTPWLAAKAAIVPGRALMGPPPRSATGTTGSAGEAWGASLSRPVLGREDAIGPHSGPHLLPSSTLLDGASHPGWAWYVE